MPNNVRAVLPLVAACFLSLATGLDQRDLHRAQTKIPRPPFKGNTPHEMGNNLNAAMRRMFPNTKPCEEWTAQELQAYQEQLYQHRHQEFDSIYKLSIDNRRLLHNSLEDYRQHWSGVNEMVAQHNHLDQMHRDGHCHEAVMWLVHHVPVEAQQTVFAHHMAPLLPLSDHSDEGGCGPDATESEVSSL